jgi:hypothetical protein
MSNQVFELEEVYKTLLSPAPRNAERGYGNAGRPSVGDMLEAL